MLSKNAIGNLKNRYKAVLEKCHLLNTFASLAFVGALTASLSAQMLVPATAKASISVDTNIVKVEEVSSGKDYFATYTGLDDKNYGFLVEKGDKSGYSASLSDIIVRTGSAVGSASTGWGIVAGAQAGFDGFDINNDGTNDYSITNGSNNALADYTPTLFNPLPVTIPEDFYNVAGTALTISSDLDTISSNFINGDLAIKFSSYRQIDEVSSNFIGNKERAIDFNRASSINTISSNFIGNHNPLLGEGGGALAYLFDGCNTNLLSSNFIGNSSAGSGGAIQLYRGTITTISSNFIGNHAQFDGGAIDLWTDNGDATLNFLANNETLIISGNTANGRGTNFRHNAIYIYTDLSSNPTGIVKFNMQGNGAYLFNDTIESNFSAPNQPYTYQLDITGENAANNVFYLNNAFKNVGDFTLSKANLSMGSVTQVYNGNSYDYSGAIIAKNATFKGDSILSLNAASYKTNAAIQGASSLLTVEAGAKLQIVNGSVGDTVHIVSGFDNASSSIAEGAWTGTNLMSSSSLQVAKVNDFDAATGSYSVTLNPLASTTNPGTGTTGVSEILNYYPKMNPDTAAFFVAVSQLNPTVNSPEIYKRLFARIFDNNYLGTSDPTLAVITAEGLLQLGSVAGTVSTSLGVSGSSLQSLQQRVNNFLQGNNISIVYLDDVKNNEQGMSAGSTANSITNGLAVWATPFYNNTRLSDVSIGAFENNYTSNLGGLALGADYTFQEKYLLGLSINGGGGSSESDGDYNKTTNDFTFMGLSLYGAMYLDKFTLTADMGYAYTNSEVEQALPTILGFTKSNTNIDSHIFTIGAGASYLFDTQWLDIIPNLGIRYTNVYTSSYDVKVSGANVVHTASDSQDIFSIPLSVTFAKDFESASGWNIRPSLDLGVTYSFGDLEATTKSSIPTVAGNATYHVENVDRFAFTGGLGLEFAKNTVSFAINYDLQASKHETNHGLQATFRYEF